MTDPLADDVSELLSVAKDDHSNSGTTGRLSPQRVSSYHEDDIRDDDDDNRSSTTSSMWAIYSGTNYVACDETIRSLPPGVYTTQESRSLGQYLKREHIVLDQLVKLPDSAGELIMSDVDKFWVSEDKFKKLGFLWKRGILMYGPPGSGKTSIIQQIASKFIAEGGICVFMDNPKMLVHCVRMLKTVEPNRPIAVLMEDIDSIVQNYGESDILALMDGEVQIDNVLFVATTNYPEKLDKRLICRPSRFDIVRKIGMPSDEARRVFLSSKSSLLGLPEHEQELDKWVRETKGFSVAHLKELIISIEVYEADFAASVKRLKSMLTNVPSSTDSEGGFGFSGNGDR
jgi:hypothetical protein